jgi:hypothetical protein
LVYLFGLGVGGLGVGEFFSMELDLVFLGGFGLEGFIGLRGLIEFYGILFYDVWIVCEYSSFDLNVVG